MNATRIYRIGEITRLIKHTLEDEIATVWVEGEVSNLVRHTSGHLYFTLKDKDAQLAAVLFAGNYNRSMDEFFSNGQLVRAYGLITVFEPRGQYQIRVNRLQPAGKGALMARLEELKQKLQAEGLFDSQRKKPLPLLPRHIGLVTSPTGAAIRDMLNILKRRFVNLRVTLSPARVQGNGAAEEIAAAIDLLVNMPEPPDVLIVGRGGGSLEDLWAFNEEIVARAIAASPVPVVSAVGHEIDFTIADMVADLRAPTPSAAAELVVGQKTNFEKLLTNYARTMRPLLRENLAEVRGRLRAIKAASLFREPHIYTQQAAQNLDTLEMRLLRALEETLVRAQRHHEKLQHRLLMMRGTNLQQLRMRLRQHNDKLTHIVKINILGQQQKLITLARTLQTLNPLAVLERGYSITHTADGALVRSKMEARVGMRLITRVADGTFESLITGDDYHG